MTVMNDVLSGNQVSSAGDIEGCQPFSGSYAAGDVLFLLKRVQIEPVSVAEKERAIQSGALHYSEMLSVEKTPDGSYLKLFYQALQQNAEKLGCHLANLCATLAADKVNRHGKEVVLVSLARAGTPIGVLLKRGVEALGHKVSHYSVSIIRDRGIDWVALDYIRARHADADIIFVDGWTGKGAITSELHSSVKAYNESRGAGIVPQLMVVADLAGCADLAATSSDYLIPSAVLNSVVSGLVSRTVLSSRYTGEGEFHACVYYAEKSGEDLSRYFIEEIMPYLLSALEEAESVVWDNDIRRRLNKRSRDFIAYAMEHYGITDRNHVKPGIGESTRVLLRRIPERLVLREPQAPDVQHLVALAAASGVPVETNSELPYRAAAFIKTVD
ncbi:MAG: cysteine protease StiP family protein [Candidatus Melainabacteria bacterium]|nr:cysteine protease StiP family protein [Candidatus Melainabacteria bacterium]